MYEEINVGNQLKRSTPIAFESLVNILMTFIDTLVISTLGTTELNALGAMTVIIDIMQMGIQTINVSNNVLIAKEIGNGKNNKANLITGNAIIITLIISIITILIAYTIKPIFPSLFNVSEICITYLVIRLIGFIQNSIVTVLSGYQRTIGNQTSMLRIRIFSVVLNLILDIVVVRMKYGIKGVAWVTVLLETMLAIYLLIKSKDNVKYKFDKKCFIDILTLFKWKYIERITSKVDNFIFNLVVAKMGSLEYSVHTILIQISNVYDAFVQGFGDGITISIGLAFGSNKKENIDKVKEVAKKIINICSLLFPVIIFIISIIVMNITLKEKELQNIFYKILPLIVISSYFTISATYYFSILRGLREFKFLAKRNLISSIVKILIVIILAYTPLGIVGVWISYLVYKIMQKFLSKRRYIKIIKENRNLIELKN